MNVRRTLAVAAALAMVPVSAQSNAADRPVAQTLEAVRAADMRLAAIGYRLATANAVLCASLQPGTGLQAHVLAQYAPAIRTDAQRHFGFAGPVAVEGVVPGSPADAAKIMPGDTIVSVNGKALDQSLPDANAAATVASLAAFDAQLAAASSHAALLLGVLRHGTAMTLDIHPVDACRTRFELLLDDAYEAQADGDLVQIGSKFLDSYTDDQVAVIVAHELSHNILRHRVRLEAAKVSFGLLAEVGKNGRLFRQTETEADQLGVVLLANAGYDPMNAARFWRGPGAKIDGGLFRARTHGGAGSRAKVTEAIAAGIAPATPRPIIPPLIATRDQPLR